MDSILTVVSLVGLLAPINVMASEEPILTSTLDVVRQTLPADQPVALRLTVINPLKTAQILSVNYPTLETTATSGLELILDGHKLAPYCLPTENSTYFQGDVRIPAIEVPATGKISIIIILNRFTDRVSKGAHQLKYNLALISRDSAKVVASTTGILQFTLTDSNNGQLITALRDWTKCLGSSNYWDKRAALEAIALADSPAAIPFKIELIKAGYPEYAFPALAKFQNNDAARKAVVAALSEKRSRVAACALLVLSLWKEPIEPQEIAKLAKTEDIILRRAIIEYCESMKSTDLSGVVTLLANDSDPEIAQKAKRLLQGKQNDH